MFSKPPRLVLIAFLCSTTPVFANELLVNGKAETGDLTGWVDALGNGFDVDGAVVQPAEGSFCFWAGVFGPSGPYSHELRQDVDVAFLAQAIDAGAAISSFSGKARSNEGSGVIDWAQIALEFRGAAGQVLGTFDTGSVQPTNTWISFSDQRPVPVGTRSLRVRLYGTRGVGSSTDAFFDDFSLVVDCELVASSTLRNAGTNPSTYTADPPIVGGLFSASVDNSAAGQSFSALFAFEASASVTLGNGQTLLCLDLGSGEMFTGAGLLPTSSNAGIDTFELCIPDIPDLCGVSFCSQAIQFGNPPFVLSNARDLVIGTF